MFVRTAFAAFVFMIVVALPAFAANGAPPSACGKLKWTGAYTRLQNIDVGTVNSYADQLNFSKDGIVTLNYTYYPELMLSEGTGTTGYGEWKCRADGNVVMSVLLAQYVSNGSGDLTLSGHLRYTFLFEIVDDNTLKRIAFARRVYLPSEDPTDPGSGTVTLSGTDDRIYSRFTISEGDLP